MSYNFPLTALLSSFSIFYAAEQTAGRNWRRGETERERAWKAGLVGGGETPKERQATPREEARGGGRERGAIPEP